MAVPADDCDVVQWFNRFGSASEVQRDICFGAGYLPLTNIPLRVILIGNIPWWKKRDTNIRQSINRFLKHPPVNRAVDIIKDSAFDGANNVFISMCKRMRLDGND
jgi:hypothetical protein